VILPSVSASNDKELVEVAPLEDLALSALLAQLSWTTPRKIAERLWIQDVPPGVAEVWPRLAEDRPEIAGDRQE
jgi:hypothetical protein